MAVPTLLNSVLSRLYSPDPADSPDGLAAACAHLLADLANPGNLAVLASETLRAPALWPQQSLPSAAAAAAVWDCDVPHAAHRLLATYASAARRVRAAPRPGRPDPDAWLCTIMAATVSPPAPDWRRLLVLVGALVGFAANDPAAPPTALPSSAAAAAAPPPALSRRRAVELQHAVVHAANAALRALTSPDAETAVVLALSHAAPLLPAPTRAALDANAVLPAAVRAITGTHGLRHGDFLSYLATAATVRAAPLQRALGPAAAVAAAALRAAPDPAVVARAHAALLDFSVSVLAHWQQQPQPTTSTSPSSSPSRSRHAPPSPTTPPPRWPLSPLPCRPASCV